MLLPVSGAGSAAPLSSRRCPTPAILPPRPLACRAQLARASEFAANFEQNGAYLLMLDPDALLYNFRCVEFRERLSRERRGGWASASGLPLPPHPPH